VRTATTATTGWAGRAAHWGAGTTRDTARTVAGVFTGPATTTGAATREPAVDFTARIPFASASLRLPGPGAVATLGPVRVTLPAGALYYGGLATLVVGGALDLPVAAGAALAGVLFGRRRFGRAVPVISVVGATPGPAPQATNNGSTASA
jgi:hypothetical protein